MPQSSKSVVLWRELLGVSSSGSEMTSSTVQCHMDVRGQVSNPVGAGYLF